MKISLILNTSCMDPHANKSHNPWRKAIYADRINTLAVTINKAADDAWHEVIVAGNYEEGTSYKYVPVQPVCRNRADALVQREQGARYATGDVLVFCHDDHRPAAGFAKLLSDKYANVEWDLLIPQRIHAVTNEVLANGKDDSPNGSYMGGHCLVMKRWLWAEVPWNSTQTEYWDHSMTRLWRNAGAQLVYADDLIHYDMEASEDEA